MKRSHDKSGLSIYFIILHSIGEREPANLARERYIKKGKKKKKNTGSEVGKERRREKGRCERRLKKNISLKISTRFSIC